MSAFEVTPEILGEFQTEANENIEHTEAALLSLERSEKPREAIQEIFRCIHTIKGSADYLGLGDIKELSHAFENILDGLRKADQPVMPKELSDLSFKILDGIKDMIAAAALGREHGVAWKELLGELTRFGAPHEARALSSVEQSPSTGGGDAKAVRIFKDSVGQQCNILTRVREKLEANQPIDPGVRGMACRALQGIGNASQFVGEEELETLSGEFKTWLSSPESSGDAGEFIHRIDGFLPKVREVLGSLCERREGRHDAVPEPEGFSSESSKEEVSPGERLSESKTIRVNQDVLDVFMNLIGELLVARNAFAHVQHGLGGGEEERVAALREFRESSRHLTHVTGELQRSVMKMRMVPVKTLFQRYPRIVRDVCRKTEKTVEVVFEGEDTEIDKGVADELAEPLIHIVRNAVDHGIESAEHRRAAGKAEFGTLIMKASHEGNFMVVEVVDDGDGIDLQRIKAKALDRGLLTSEQADKITKAELLEYISNSRRCSVVSTWWHNQNPL